VERGPEYSVAAGTFSVIAGKPAKLAVELERLVNLAAEGWWSGDLHVHRPIEEIELLMRAEDLHIAPVITWWNNRNLWADRPLPDRLTTQFDGNRFYDRMAGEDEREGGALLYFHLPRPLAITGATREYPSPMRFLAEARRHDRAWVDIEKPFWWDVPTWLATGQIDSIGLANNHMCRSRMYESEAWGKPRDVERLPAPLGNGIWTQEIYYHILNSGLRIPPSAGSASGVLPNPVGYNRVYAYVDGDLTYEKWWDSLKVGQSFVTNGPLLRVRSNGELPGHVFRVSAGELTVNLDVQLAHREPIRRLDIIVNGSIHGSVSGDEWAATKRLKSFTMTEGGWFLVRAIADNPATFRFASTAPFFVELGEVKSRVSKASSQFFLDWCRERMDRIKIDDPAQRREVLDYHHRAQLFWENRVAGANAN
jgi:hypothetical protein